MNEILMTVEAAVAVGLEARLALNQNRPFITRAARFDADPRKRSTRDNQVPLCVAAASRRAEASAVSRNAPSRKASPALRARPCPLTGFSRECQR